MQRTRPPQPSRPAPGDALQSELERRYLAGQLERHGGNVTAAAGASDVDRSCAHRLIRERGIETA